MNHITYTQSRLKQFALSRGYAFSLKLLGILAQLTSMLLVMEMQPLNVVSQYYATVALATIASVIITLGYNRYCFRIMQRPSSDYVAAARSLSIFWLCSIPCVPIMLLYSMYQSLNIIAILCIYSARLLSEAYVVNRHRLVLNDAIPRTLLIEVLQPLTFILMMGAFFLIEQETGDHYLGLTGLGILYLISNAIMFISSVRMTHSTNIWLQAFVVSIRLGAIAPLMRAIKRGLPVGYDAILNTLLNNVTIVIADFFHRDTAVVLLGIFQRLYFIAQAFITITVMYRLKGFYKAHITHRQALKTLAISLAMVIILWISGHLAYNILYLPFFSAFESQFLGNLRQLSSAILPIAATVGCYYIVQHLSYAALGADKRYLRVWAIKACTASLIIMLIFIFSYTTLSQQQQTSWAIIAYAAAMSINAMILWIGLFRKNNGA